MLRLYYAPHTCALASHLALEQAGPAYDTVRVDFSKHGQRAAARRSLDRILAWDFDRVVMSHGEVVSTGGHRLVEQAFAFLR
jgi:hypothetical protein